MKIISTYKDYYDFCQGVYGQDEKICYVRGSLENLPLTDPLSDSCLFYRVHICGVVYHVFNYKFANYFGEDGAKMVYDMMMKARNYKKWSYSSDESMINNYIRAVNSQRWFNNIDKHLSETNVNDKLNLPVYIEQMNYRLDATKTYTNVKLSELNMASILPAHDIFLQIGTFLSREKPVVDNRDDIAKLESYGFDKKTSFRKM
jgi:hypothetical protein